MQHASSSAYPARGARHLRTIGLGVAIGVFLSLTAAAQSATPPENVTRPVITGTAKLGATLYASPGRWRSPAPLRYTFRWWRCPTADRCGRIPVAPGRTYRITQADIGQALLVRVTARSRLGVARASSPRVAIPDPGAAPSPDVLFQDRFDRPDGLVTNEWAFRHPDDRDAVVSPDWYMTSGSLFTSGRVGWTGVPDRRGPDAASAEGTGSAVFRLVTHRRDFGNVAVSFSLRNDEVVSTMSTPPVAWDGVHVFLRYQNPDRLYSASANRRDGTVVIKKKCPGGPSNGGVYYSLSPSSVDAVPYGEWQRIVATVRNLTPDSVELRLEIGGRIVAAAVDDGLGCAPITSAGAVGIRGDNANFRLDNFVVSQLD